MKAAEAEPKPLQNALTINIKSDMGIRDRLFTGKLNLTYFAGRAYFINEMGFANKPVVHFNWKSAAWIKTEL